MSPADLATLGESGNWAPSATDRTWARGDFIGEGAVGPTDLAMLGSNWMRRLYILQLADANDDGVVDDDDDSLIDGMGTDGDFDGDGDEDAIDEEFWDRTDGFRWAL